MHNQLAARFEERIEESTERPGSVLSKNYIVDIPVHDKLTE
jgi:hypothetical protein